MIWESLGNDLGKSWESLGKQKYHKINNQFETVIICHGFISFYHKKGWLLTILNYEANFAPQRLGNHRQRVKS